MQKCRLDVILVENGQVQSRERAKSLIMSGVVFVNGERVDKAGTTVDENSKIDIQFKER